MSEERARPWELMCVLGPRPGRTVGPLGKAGRCCHGGGRLVKGLWGSSLALSVGRVCPGQEISEPSGSSRVTARGVTEL